ncbi:single-stranded DNA-binding protein [Clavibacter michiganensis]|uniref:single-stranded DNA-binding protein n=1 Tax=Clavibacter michiganensis TaxID=28447 RepID=UPI00292FE51C|nr:single-stranded DNA-binding protein [Clavibacter michiganensis]
MSDPDMTPEQQLAFDLGKEVGYLEGVAACQAHINEVEDRADRYYRAAYGDERRLQVGDVSRAELEERRRAMAEQVTSITVDDAIRSWGLSSTTTRSDADPATTTAPTNTTPRTTQTNRRRTMSYINLTGNLASTPVLREGNKGPYTYATVIVTDRFRNDAGEYVDGPKMAYELAVSGAQATGLVATAKACGNIRVTFSGDYTVREFVGEKGTFVQHKVRVDEIGASFRHQNITVERHATAAKAGEE